MPKTKKDIVQEWQEENPYGRKCDCIRETGISAATVRKWWDDEKNYRPKEHRNILKVSRRSENNNRLTVICRGSWVGEREEKLHSFLASSENGDDNSYLFFKDEPTNEYDPNAIKIVSGGEIFGTVGYVAREQTMNIKKILKEARSYRIDVIDEKEIGSKNLRLRMEWIPK